MGGDMLNDLWELTPPREGPSTVVIVGKTGNGKSATGNSILGREAFVSDLSSRGVTTTTCQLETTVLPDKERIVNVIDTPGLFDFSSDSEVLGKEILNCIRLAKDGIHVVLMVFSLNSRFTTEEYNVIKSMQSFFGERIVDYMILVFTGGDVFQATTKTLDDYLSTVAEPLKEIVELCENRVMLFDNRTQDKTKQARQVEQLLFLVDLVVANNDGRPFSDEIFDELKIKWKLDNAMDRVEKQLAEEQVARMKSEEETSKLKEQLEAKMKSEEELSKLKLEAKMKSEEELSKLKLEAEMKSEEIRKLKEQLEAKNFGSVLKEHLRRAQEDFQELLRRVQEMSQDMSRRAQEESQEFRKRAESNKSCTIL